MGNQDYDYEKMRQDIRKKKEELEKKYEDAKRKELRKKGINQDQINYNAHKYHDSIYTMDNDEATILYIAVMLLAIIFKDRALIWTAATIIYVYHINRHKFR